MNDLFGRRNNQAKHSGKIPSCRQSSEPDELARLGPAWRRVKMKTLLIEQASARVCDSRGSLISARFCQSRPYIRHYIVRSYLYSLRIIQRICFVCQFMLYPVSYGVLQNSANSKIDVRFIYYYYY